MSKNKRFFGYRRRTFYFAFILILTWRDCKLRCVTEWKVVLLVWHNLWRIVLKRWFIVGGN